MPQPLDKIAEMFRALADESRLAIFLRIRDLCEGCCTVDDVDTARCVSEIAEAVGVSISTASHHIRELRNAGLIDCERNGRWRCCTINDQALERMRQFLASGELETA